MIFSESQPWDRSRSWPHCDKIIRVGFVIAINPGIPRKNNKWATVSCFDLISLGGLCCEIVETELQDLTPWPILKSHNHSLLFQTQFCLELKYTYCKVTSCFKRNHKQIWTRRCWGGYRKELWQRRSASEPPWDLGQLFKIPRKQIAHPQNPSPADRKINRPQRPKINQVMGKRWCLNESNWK